MIYELKTFLRNSFPFLITLFLWYLSVSFWNPAGILALIPIFYYSFVKPTNYFSLYAFLFCFLIDYRCDLTLLWSFMFCLFYAINGFQKFIDLTRTDNNAINIFMVFFGLGIFVLTLSHFTWLNLIHNIWLMLWVWVLYTPITALDKWINK